MGENDTRSTEKKNKGPAFQKPQPTEIKKADNEHSLSKTFTAVHPGPRVWLS